MVNKWDVIYAMGMPPWDTGEPPRELVELIENNILKPCNSMDLGCGTGGLIEFLSKAGFRAYGIDISKIAINRAYQRLNNLGINTRIICADIFEYYPENKFDLVTDVGCYHSLPYNQRRKYSDLILNRYLKPEGDLLLWVINDIRYNLKPPYNISPREVRINFIEKGFKLIRMSKTRLPFILRIIEGPRGYFIWLKIEKKV
jgi:SAM-dependent methyltransferase